MSKDLLLLLQIDVHNRLLSSVTERASRVVGVLAFVQFSLGLCTSINHSLIHGALLTYMTLFCLCYVRQSGRLCG